MGDLGGLINEGAYYRDFTVCGDVYYAVQGGSNF